MRKRLWKNIEVYPDQQQQAHLVYILIYIIGALRVKGIIFGYRSPRVEISQM
jgi:hypothetical protein